MQGAKPKIDSSAIRAKGPPLSLKQTRSRNSSLDEREIRSAQRGASVKTRWPDAF